VSSPRHEVMPVEHLVLWRHRFMKQDIHNWVGLSRHFTICATTLQFLHCHYNIYSLLRSASRFLIHISHRQHSVQRLICLVVQYAMMYLLTAIGLSPGGSSTVYIYKQKIHRTIQNKQYTEQHNNFGRVRTVLRLG
jgi:hypothetical protein